MNKNILLNLASNLKPLLTAACLLIGFSAQQNTFAQDNQNTLETHERRYQVEMIIFSRTEKKLNNANQQEIWPKNITLAYPNNLISLKPTGSNDADGFTLLAPNERRLNSQAATITKNANYTLLFHQAWRQMIYRKNTSIFISGGKTFNGHQELEGSIDLSVGQYLKFKNNLWLTQFLPLAITANASAAAPEANESWPELPALPNADFMASDTISDATTGYFINRIVKITQQRSMRSVEIHYIDHPLLGIIITIVPTAAN
jgi:hypothetical protein